MHWWYIHIVQNSKVPKGIWLTISPALCSLAMQFSPKEFFWGAQFLIFPSSGILCKYIQLLECRWNFKDQIRVRPRKTGCDWYCCQPTRWKFPKDKITYTDLLWDFSVLDFTHLPPDQSSSSASPITSTTTQSSNDLLLI